MKCFACDGSGVECCPYCESEGDCAHCGGRGNGPCLLCDGVGEEPHPDSFGKKRRAKVPAPIRKIVEQHVAAQLPAEILAISATCTPVEMLSVLTPRSSILAAAWRSEAFAENGSVTTTWQPAAPSAAVGTTVISGSSPGSPRRRSEDCRRRSAVGNRGNSSSVSSSPNFSSTAAAPLALGQAYRPNRPACGNAFCRAARHKFSRHHRTTTLQRFRLIPRRTQPYVATFVGREHDRHGFRMDRLNDRIRRRRKEAVDFVRSGKLHQNSISC